MTVFDKCTSNSSSYYNQLAATVPLAAKKVVRFPSALPCVHKGNYVLSLLQCRPNLVNPRDKSRTVIAMERYRRAAAPGYFVLPVFTALQTVSPYSCNHCIYTTSSLSLPHLYPFSVLNTKFPFI